METRQNVEQNWMWEKPSEINNNINNMFLNEAPQQTASINNRQVRKKFICI